MLQFVTWNQTIFVALTLCETQVHAGEEQNQDKSVKLHGCCCSSCCCCCSWCVVHCTNTRRQRAKSNWKLELDSITPTALKMLGKHSIVFQSISLPSSSCERIQSCLWPLSGFQLLTAVPLQELWVMFCKKAGVTARTPTLLLSLRLA